MAEKILIIGALGQIGIELTEQLSVKFGAENVIPSDIKNETNSFPKNQYEQLDVLDKEALEIIVKKHNITQVYLLAALLSATAEQKPKLGWDLSIDGLFHVLDLAKEKKINKVFWPSSIAVFGANTPKQNTPQHTIVEPSTVYGMAKLAGERWCEYYHKKYNVDVRSIRYPGLIGYKSQPGGGTTDYAVTIFYDALKEKTHQCYLAPNTILPMMYMEDAIRATLEIMEAPRQNITVNSSYNLAGLSFSPQQLANEIIKHIPSFKIEYTPDFRNEIASTWAQSIDDSKAKKDWGWKPNYSLSDMVLDMIKNIKSTSL